MTALGQLGPSPSDTQLELQKESIPHTFGFLNLSSVLCCVANHPCERPSRPPIPGNDQASRIGRQQNKLNPVAVLITLPRAVRLGTVPTATTAATKGQQGPPAANAGVIT